MFDIGFWELAVIAVVALVVIGPERLPRAARTAGLWVGRARRMVAEVKSDIDREINAEELREIKSIGEDLKDTRTVFEKAASSMTEVPRDLQKDVLDADADDTTAG
ncbi:MAG: Sec-independent protein translocase protein TatB, partial [Gammaproteobacteria bacterium]|nr:Sec-independent protein translocase protein TatB [Gammaproteobacteria bacterium]